MLETNVVDSGVPFQLTVDVLARLLPLTVRVKEPLPVIAAVGLRLLSAGDGLIRVRRCGPVPVITTCTTPPLPN